MAASRSATARTRASCIRRARCSGQGTTIFGSSNWTNESNVSQAEHNYFTNKPWLQWFKDNFERKWNNSAGAIETAPFHPLPPDPPSCASPANGATGVATSGTALRWNPGLWGWTADVYFGTSPAPPLLAANVSATPSEVHAFTLPALNPGTTYYWKIVSKTAALQQASGAVFSFTTAGGDAATAECAADDRDLQPGAEQLVLRPATIAIAANASDSDGTIVRVDFYAGGTLVGSDAASPYQVTWSNVAAGSYTLTARATDNAGATATSSGVAIAVTSAPPPSQLPTPWQSQDIGAVGPAGHASAANGTFSVSGAARTSGARPTRSITPGSASAGDADVIARVASENTCTPGSKRAS